MGNGSDRFLKACRRECVDANVWMRRLFGLCVRPGGI